MCILFHVQFRALVTKLAAKQREIRRLNEELDKLRQQSLNETVYIDLCNTDENSTDAVAHTDMDLDSASAM